MMCGLVASAGRAAPPPDKPAYPRSYVELNRIGEVLARCDVSAGRHVTGCRILAAEGGKAFSDSVLAWFALPHPPAEATLPTNAGRTRDYFIRFAPDGYRGVVFGPVSWRIPPPVQRRGASNCGLMADCTIMPGGAPRDCRIIGLEPGDPDIATALAWLRDADVHYQNWPDLEGGAHRIVSLSPDTIDK